LFLLNGQELFYILMVRESGEERGANLLK